MLAERAHAGQVDKAGFPYIGHLERVAGYVDPSDPLAQTAALLHDSIEDTSLTSYDLADHGIPAPAIEAIELLTRRPDQNAEDYYQAVRENALAREVKLADLADNSDPARLALLPDALHARLTRKYSAAYRALGACVDDGDLRRARAHGVQEPG
ncbi:guanosine-3',5'-bis(diphosphate) 3'-pyrophosphohydrolase [Mycobacterium sp. 1245805.9]|nr:guanosine-3',5'-bis(diphosphate) 3'-pyrophosphohydrolase [Mycobacterium sp. 1245805.9]